MTHQNLSLGKCWKLFCATLTDTVLERVIHDSFAENGRKLFVTMHIKNVTMEDDSQNVNKGSYECHAYAVGDKKGDSFGFSVNVIKSKTL